MLLRSTASLPMPAVALRMPPRSVTMTLNWHVPPGEARPLTEALQFLMIAARTERGYVNCSVSAEMGDAKPGDAKPDYFAKVRYREEWQTEEDLQRQVKSPRFAKLAELIEHASGRPLVQFHLTTSVRGLDYAEELLGRDHHDHK